VERVSIIVHYRDARLPPGIPAEAKHEYSQTAILSFLDVDRPHISVATLVKRRAAPSRGVLESRRVR